jgi:hypothetical protein
MEEMRRRLNQLSQRLNRLERGNGPGKAAGQPRRRIQVLRTQRDRLNRILAEMPPADDVSSQSWKGARYEFEQAIGRLERLCERALARAEAWQSSGESA